MTGRRRVPSVAKAAKLLPQIACCFALCASATSRAEGERPPHSDSRGDAQASGPAPAAQVKRFVSCPIYRDVDAGRKSSCWLATERRSGIRYDVGESPNKPQLGREVLVEGVLSKDDDICGGVVLNPVRVSVLDSTCPRALLPAEGYPGRVFVLPEVLPPRRIPRAPPAPPYETREFTVYFEWNSDFLRYQHAEIVLDKALTYIKASSARVLITGYADTQRPHSPDVDLVEPLALAKARAQMVAEAFLRLGLPKNQLVLAWSGPPKPDALAKTGLIAPSRRRVTIVVLPAKQ